MKHLGILVVLLSMVLAVILEVVLPISLIVCENIDVPIAILAMIYSNGTILQWVYYNSEYFEELSKRQQALMACIVTIMAFDILLLVL